VQRIYLYQGYGHLVRLSILFDHFDTVMDLRTQHIVEDRQILTIDGWTLDIFRSDTGVYFWGLRNSAHTTAVAIATFKDSLVGIPSG